MKQKKPESVFAKLLPIVGGIVIGALIILIVLNPNFIGSTFWTYALVALVFLAGTALTILLIPRSEVEKKDLEVWEKYEKRTHARFIMQETFLQPISFLAALILGGILFIRHYLKQQASIDYIALYLMPTLIVIVANFMSAFKLWKAMEKAIEAKKFKIQ